MADLKSCRSMHFNEDKYLDKVLGCWTGKNIGGTLGAPFEGRREMQNISFYAQKLNGAPAPNDDLDLQLVWLEIAELYGLMNLDCRRFGNAWLDHIVAGWNEYGVCCCNLRCGFQPPLTGVVNNDIWKWSNGAWIRSEIWACLFPGSPEFAARFAWMDASADHCGEGIYAELFTASLESAAFVVSDLRELVRIALAMIPADSRVAASVKLACESYDKGLSLADARNAIVRQNEDLGWFQAPANVAFTVLGLLYGEGDFGRTVCAAVNCGDDTDCTGATAGSVMGIILGRSGIPKEWIEPIGESIRTVAINTLANNITIPATLDELTLRVAALAKRAVADDPRLPAIGDGDDRRDADYIASLASPSAGYLDKVLGRPSSVQSFDLPWGELEVDYVDGAEASCGDRFRLKLHTVSPDIATTEFYTFDWKLPEGWSVTPGAGAMRRSASNLEFTFEVGSFSGIVEGLVLEVRLSGRMFPAVIHIPVVQRGSMDVNMTKNDWCASDNRLRQRRQLAEVLAGNTR